MKIHITHIFILYNCHVLEFHMLSSETIKRSLLLEKWHNSHLNNCGSNIRSTSADIQWMKMKLDNPCFSMIQRLHWNIGVKNILIISDAYFIGATNSIESVFKRSFSRFKWQIAIQLIFTEIERNIPIKI